MFSVLFSAENFVSINLHIVFYLKSAQFYLLYKLCSFSEHCFIKLLLIEAFSFPNQTRETVFSVHGMGSVAYWIHALHSHETKERALLILSQVFFFLCKNYIPSSWFCLVHEITCGERKVGNLKHALLWSFINYL